MKITIEIEVDDDLEPCTYGCEMGCPFGYYEADGDSTCDQIRRIDDEWKLSCLVKEAMEKGKN